MIETKRLVEIAEDVGLHDLSIHIADLGKKMEQVNSQMLLPLVGEFSSGKTTLINSLTDSKSLETATKPTTATIYEIFFGCPKNSATVIYENGTMTHIDDISSLKNDNLTDATVVSVFDTAKKIPTTTVLVDTPGLSSPEPKHKKILMDFLPNSDAVLLVSDINQQLTKTLLDFIKEMELVKRPVFLILTKTDTKSKTEIEQARKYASDTAKIPLSQIACVSAKDGNLEEFYSLINEINKQKTKILKDVNEQRISNDIKIILERIDEILSIKQNNKDFEQSISDLKIELTQLNNNINSLLTNTQNCITNIKQDTCNEFNQALFQKMDSLVANKSQNYNVDAINIINSTTSVYFSNYKNRIQKQLYKLADERSSTKECVNLNSLKELNLNSLEMKQFQYNFDLNEVGHQYDGYLAIGAKVVVTIGLVAATIAAAPVAAGADAAAMGVAATGAATTATGIGAALNAADTVADVASMVENKKTKEDIKEMLKKVPEQFNKNLSDVENYNQQYGKSVGSDKGFVESLVSSITDKTSKPQRQKLIHDYLNNQLLPCFEVELDKISNDLLNLIRTTLKKEAEQTIAEKNDSLQKLKTELETSKKEFQARMDKYKSYKMELA